MRKAIVWGGSGGIGSAVTEKLLGSGWDVAVISRNPEKASFNTSNIFYADVDDPASIEKIMGSLGEISDSFDLFVYAIGDITAEKVKSQKPDNWNRILNANLNGAYLATHYSLPLLAKDAHLVYLGAITEKLARIPRLAAYAAAKGGLQSFVDVLAREERKRRITLVRPSAVKTEFWEKVPFSAPEEALTAEQVADEILKANSNGHKGNLDL